MVRPSVRRLHLVRRFLVAAIVLAALSAGRAVPFQSGEGAYFDPVGLQPDRGYFSELPWEHVDMVNGRVILKFTDLVLPGNAGMDLRFIRVLYAGGPSSGASAGFGIEGIPIAVEPADDDPEQCCDYPTFIGVDSEEKSFPESGVMGAAEVYLTRQFWRYTVATRTLELPNGWTGTYGTNGRLEELRDPFLNSVTFTYSGVGLQLA